MMRRLVLWGNSSSIAFINVSAQLLDVASDSVERCDGADSEERCGAADSEEEGTNRGSALLGTESGIDCRTES